MQFDFEDQFHSDLDLCYVWAEPPSRRRVKFVIPAITLEFLGGNPVVGARNVRMCEQERFRIEQACGRAFAEEPGNQIWVEPRHFDEMPARKRTV